MGRLSLINFVKEILFYQYIWILVQSTNVNLSYVARLIWLIWTILYGPYHIVHIIWSILYSPYHMARIHGPYHTGRIRWSVSYRLYDIAHIIWSIMDRPYHMVSIIWSVSYGPYDMVHLNHIWCGSFWAMISHFVFRAKYRLFWSREWERNSTTKDRWNKTRLIQHRNNFMQLDYYETVRNVCYQIFWLLHAYSKIGLIIL